MKPTSPVQFRLRTLLIVLAVGRMVLAGVWAHWQSYLRTMEDAHPMVEHFVGETKLDPIECSFESPKASPLP